MFLLKRCKDKAKGILKTKIKPTVNYFHQKK